MGIEKRSLIVGGCRPLSAVPDLEILQESSIPHFACPLPENPNTFYLKIVGSPSFPNRVITKKIYF